MYKLTIPRYTTEPEYVIRTFDNAWVPLTDPANTDYQAYLKWLEEGNTPEPADEENT